MKNNVLNLLLLLFLLFQSACTKNEFEFENDFNRSYDAWHVFKQQSNNSYTYSVSNSTWTGSSWNTTITVLQGRIIQRDFHYSKFNDFQRPDGGWTIQTVAEIINSYNDLEGTYNSFTPEELLQILEWREDEHNLGSQKSSVASNLITLDEVYELAKNQWLAHHQDVHTSFEAKHDGMISIAGFSRKDCMDDCFVGITITAIQPFKR